MSAADEQQTLITIVFRIQIIEQQLKQVQDQLKAYVPIKENELQLQSIQMSVTRIERDVVDIRSTVTAIGTKQDTLEKESRLRDENQRLSQANLQIRALWTIISAVIFIATSIFIGYVTHFFH